MNELPGRDPTSFPLITYAWVIALSVWGGGVNFYRKLKSGHARPFNFIEIVGELFTSAFAGVVTFYLCQSASIDGVLSAVFVAISGHMGSRAIFLFENWASKKWGGQ